MTCLQVTTNSPCSARYDDDDDDCVIKMMGITMLVIIDMRSLIWLLFLVTILQAKLLM